MLPHPELHYLRVNKKNRVCVSSQLHDPIGIVHILQDFVEDVLFQAHAVDRNVPLKTLFLLGVKSGRLSILLRALLLFIKYKETFLGSQMHIFDDIYTFITEIKPSHAEKESSAPRVTRSKFNREAYTGIGGMILSFGKSDHGKLGHGDCQIHRSIPTLIESLQERGLSFVRLASMSTYSLAVTSSGAVYVWGTGGSNTGLASQGLRTDVYPQILDAISSKLMIVDVSCGLGHALFLTKGGKVYTWGNGGNGRLGLGTALKWLPLKLY